MLVNKCIWRKLSLCQLKLAAAFVNGTALGVRNYKVAVVGAAGGIGQPLSMLLKQNPLITELALHDIEHVPGVAADVSHICTGAKVEFFVGDKMKECVKDAHVVIVPAGLPRKPGMTRDQLLGSNGDVAISVACAVSDASPKALLAFITNPINSLLPIAAELLKSKGTYDPNRLFGVTTLDIVRAKTFIAEFMCTEPSCIDIPVIGGHAGITILPLFSNCQPEFTGELEDVKKLTGRIQEAGTEVVKAKAGEGSATLSMAYAAAHFVNALLRGLNDEPDVIECAYVPSCVTELPFFANPIELGPNGIKSNSGLPPLDELEEKSLEKMLPELKKSIDAGIGYAKDVIKGTKKSD